MGGGGDDDKASEAGAALRLGLGPGRARAMRGPSLLAREGRAAGREEGCSRLAAAPQPHWVHG